MEIQMSLFIERFYRYTYWYELPRVSKYARHSSKHDFLRQVWKLFVCTLSGELFL